MLDVSPRTLRRYISAGTIRGVRLPGGQWRVDEAEILGFDSLGSKVDRIMGTL